MLQCTNTWRPLVFSLSQRSLKFRSKSNERSTSVSSHRNIWDYLRSDYRNLPFRFWQTGSLPCFSYERNSEKELKLRESDSLWLARFDGKFLGYSHIWSTPHVINAILGHYGRFWIFWRESFGARKLRLAARGSRLGLAGSQNSLPLIKKCKRFSNDFRSFPNVNVFERISNIFYDWPKFAKKFEDSKKGSEDVLT